MEAGHRVVIIGGGFGGLAAVEHLRNAPVEVTLIDRRNFHLFQPLLYQVATGALSPANIAAPLRSVLKRYRNTTVLLAEASDFDLAGRRVLLSDGELPYDTLIVATGSGQHYFGNDHWAPLAPSLKTLEDASEIRRRILAAFEGAEREADPTRIPQWLTFVVVGGGPTGVELAGTMAELSRDTLARDFRNINPAHAQILLVEGEPRLLASYPGELSAKAETQLRQLGVTVRTGIHVTNIRGDAVDVKTREGSETIATRTVIWAAGVHATPLAQTLAMRAGLEPARDGTIPCQADLSLPGHPEVFVIGDMAHCCDEQDRPLPGVAQVAMQQGNYVAGKIYRQLEGDEATEPFHYHDRGSMATIGRARAVATIGRLKFSGFIAWALWLFVHLMYIVQFTNRILILVQWAGNYLTWNRSARLILNRSPLPFWKITPKHPNDSLTQDTQDT